MAKKPEDVLKTVPLFEGLSKSELKHIAGEVREELYSPGQEIVSQGQTGGPFFVITEGQADVIIDGKKMRDIGPGSSFGEMAVLDGSPRSATIRAETHVKALAISSFNFLAILQDNWDITKKILAQLSGHIRKLEGH
jgi:CRP/FNR family transcriptional regulator, cyclic AMP receptor protein